MLAIGVGGGKTNSREVTPRDPQVTLSEVSLCLVKVLDQSQMATQRLCPLGLGRSYKRVRETLGIIYSDTMRIYQESMPVCGMEKE